MNERIQAAIEYYCKYQERSHHEVVGKLRELGCWGEEADELLAYVIEKGLLNEERYAKALARGKFRMKSWGRIKIVQALKLNRVSEYCIKAALKEIDEDEYETTLNRLLEKKMEELRAERNSLQKKGKLYRYLVQKGYEQQMVSAAINKLFTK